MAVGEGAANDELVKQCVSTLLAAVEAMPFREGLGVQLADAEAAQARGYYEPHEDERLRESYSRYLGVRVALWETVERLQPLLESEEEALDWEQRLRAFAVTFASAAILVRGAAYMVDLVQDRSVVWKKLDEADARYGIPRKSFTQIYESLSSTKRMWRYYESWRFYELHKPDLAAILAGPVFGPLWEVLERQEPYFESRRRDYLRRRLDFGLFDFRRRHRSGYQKVMFHLFKLSGSTIAELRQPFVKPLGAPKRVSPDICVEAAKFLQPGDVLVTRHDDALSNLFLPGFWPHAALYIGTNEQRMALGLPSTERAICPRTGEEACVLESRKDGVLLRALSDTLAVDAFAVLRPSLEGENLSVAIARALKHKGKLYDFLFDFRQSDRLACTALVYRTYHGIGGVQFTLNERVGRVCLSAEDLLNQALGSKNFDVWALFGVESDEFFFGLEAREKLLASYGSELAEMPSNQTL